MSRNELGNFVRERRMELGLTQEQLAERVGGRATQAEISRLERGQVMLPRRSRMEALAVALNVSLGSLLVHSGWLTEEEKDNVDGLRGSQESPVREDVTVIAADLNELRGYLLAAVERVTQLEARLQDPSPQSEVQASTGLFKDWETKAIIYV